MLSVESEQGRVGALMGLDILDTTSEQPFDTLVGLVADIFNAPICAISLIGADRQWFKASVGLNASETPRDVAFCDYTIRGEGSLVVGDALLDDRFANNPLVANGPRIRFYAGASVFSQGFAIGALCICDYLPRCDFSASDERRLRDFAGLVSEFIAIRKGGWPASQPYYYVD